MKFLFPFFIFISLSLDVSAQLSEKPEIKIDTKFTLELMPKNSLEFDYRILKSEPYNNNKDEYSARKALSDSLKPNQVQGVFTTGYFGDKLATLLIIKTGNERPLEYNLSIKRNGKRKFKKTSTIAITTVPNIEVWQEKISSLKFSNFKRMPFESFIPEVTIDTICYSNYDTSKGNKLFREQMPLILKIVSNQSKRIEIDQIKTFEDSINSSVKSNWGYLNNLLIKKGERYMDGYIKSRKIAPPLVFEITECPFFKRNTAYYFTKRKKDIKLILFEWKLRWVDGWQSQDYSKISENYQNKYEFLKITLSDFMSIDEYEHPNHESSPHEIIWFKKDDISAKLSLYINERYNDYSLSLHIYKQD